MTTKKEEIIEGEVVENNPIVRVEDLPVRSSERIDADTVIANIDAQEKILTRLIRYVNEKLKPKVDYYSVKEGQLPSLGLSGAEKICDIFKLAPSPILEEKIVTPQEVSYEYIVKLHNRYTGDFMGSGVGCCSSLEDKFRYYYDKKGNKQEIKNHLNIANTIKKIAYKRGYVDATLKATMASFIFTQDLEELPDYYIGSKSKKSTGGVKGGKPKLSPDDKFIKAKEYWDKYSFDGKEMKEKPPKLSGKKFSGEQASIFNYAKGLIPEDTIPSFFESLTKKKTTWEFTYEDFKTSYKALKEIEEETEEKIEDGFEKSEGKIKV